MYYEQVKWLLIAAGLGHETAQAGVAPYKTYSAYKDRYDDLNNSALKTISD